MQHLTAEEALEVRTHLNQITEQIERVIVGKREIIQLALIALLARGHVLIEDIPGVGKTMLAKTFARAVGGTFKRIQFTPDLLPGDVTGITLYNQGTNSFAFHPGPIFANIVLADEINRATPKTQSSLLEAMEESQVTVEGSTRRLPQPFFVLATQNPIEYRGTYPLPEAQMDRFLMRLRPGYPNAEEEFDMLTRFSRADLKHGDTGDPLLVSHAVALLREVQPILSIEQVQRLQLQRSRVLVSSSLQRYIVRLIRATREDVKVVLGASPRAALALQRASQAAAVLVGREYVLPDDVKFVAPYILEHRLLLSDVSGQHVAAQLIERIMRETPVS